MARKYTAKERRRTVFRCLFSFFVICFSLILSASNIIEIKEKRKEKKELSIKLESLKEEETILKDDVEKLKNTEYAARYAREKYLYSKNGEKILKID